MGPPPIGGRSWILLDSKYSKIDPRNRYFHFEQEIAIKFQQMTPFGRGSRSFLSVPQSEVIRCFVLLFAQLAFRCRAASWYGLTCYGTHMQEMQVMQMSI